MTYFNGYFFCYGGYDGERNHMDLLVYSITEQRWIRPQHVAQHHPPPQLHQQQIVPPVQAPGNHLEGPYNNSDINNNNNPVQDDRASGVNLEYEQDKVVNNSNQNNKQHQQPPAAPASANYDLNHPSNNNNNNVDPSGAFSGLNVAGNVAAADNGGDSTTIFVQGTPPAGRNGHSATLAPDESDDDCAKIIIIGGWLGYGPLAASDMHVLDVSAGGRQLRWYQPAVKGTPPGPCNIHSADYVPQRREVYVFRGGNGRDYLSALHALSVADLTWREVVTVGEKPQPRANHGSAMLEETAELCLFGGWNGSQRLNDIFILDVETSCWTRPRVGGVLPHPRSGMTLTALRGRLMLFGGSGTAAKCFNDLQILDRQEMVWLDVSQADTNLDAHHGNSSVVPSSNDEDTVPTFLIQGRGPGRRAGHTATAVNRKIYVFGGAWGSIYLNDFFVLDADPPPSESVSEATSLQLIESRLLQTFNGEFFED